MSTVPSDPNLTRQPSTIAPNVEIEDDPPLAMGHNEDRAGEVAEAIEAHKEQVDAEREAFEEHGEVGPRAPGDHAGSEDVPETDDQAAVRPSDKGSETLASQASDCPPEGTVEEVKAWVGDDHERAQQALEAERSGQGRSTLIAWLEDV